MLQTHIARERYPGWLRMLAELPEIKAITGMRRSGKLKFKFKTCR